MPPRKRSLDMRTPDTPAFHIPQPPKRMRQGPSAASQSSWPVPATVPTPNDHVQSAAASLSKGKSKGKEVARWLDHVEAAHSGVDMPMEANPERDIETPVPIYFDVVTDTGYHSGATAGSSEAAAQSETADSASPPPSDAGEDASLGSASTALSDDEDDENASSDSSGGSDSSWASTTRDGSGAPGEWRIDVHPEWVREVQMVWSATPRRDMFDVPRQTKETPLWMRVLRTVLPFF